MWQHCHGSTTAAGVVHISTARRSQQVFRTKSCMCSRSRTASVWPLAGNATPMPAAVGARIAVVEQNLDKLHKTVKLEAQKSETTAGLVDTEVSELRSQIGDLKRDLGVQTVQTKLAGKQALSLECMYLHTEKLVRVLKGSSASVQEPPQLDSTHLVSPLPLQMSPSQTPITSRVPLDQPCSGQRLLAYFKQRPSRDGTENRSPGMPITLQPPFTPSPASVHCICPFAPLPARILSPACGRAWNGYSASQQLDSILPRRIVANDTSDDIDRIAESPGLLKEILTQLEIPCNEIDLYASTPSKYSEQDKRRMEGCVASGSDAQGKLGLVVLAKKAGKLQNLSAPCCLCPRLFWTCTKDAMLTDATDPSKQHFIEAKTAGEVVCNDATCISLLIQCYVIWTRWRHDDRTATRWDSTIGLLRPAGAKFRIFKTTGDTLDQIFDHMANSCYEVFITHSPKLLDSSALEQETSCIWIGSSPAR
eukprot:2183039-Rhodomonas_salina.1